MNLLYLLPKNLLSRLAGALAAAAWPGPLMRAVLRAFAARFRINLAEAEKPLEAYASLDEFFTRRLKPGLRPIAAAPLVHPADSRITELGRIEQGRLIQAKGKLYSIEKLLQDPEAPRRYEGGLFATFYLCPTDYHRVHVPADGEAEAVAWVPGRLWPVNAWSVGRIDELFCVNERVVVEMKTALGPLAVVLVGATNVGKITLAFEPRVSTNRAGQRETQRFRYNPGVPLKKGDELGMFHMGSTVVLCASRQVFEKKTGPLWEAFKGRFVKLGQPLL